MKVMGNFTQGGESIHFVFFLAVITRKNDKFMLSLTVGFRCVFSIKSSVFQQNYCISRINLCGHTTSPAGKLGGATDNNDGKKVKEYLIKQKKIIAIITNSILSEIPIHRLKVVCKCITKSSDLRSWSSIAFTMKGCLCQVALFSDAFLSARAHHQILTINENSQNGYLGNYMTSRPLSTGGDGFSNYFRMGLLEQIFTKVIRR